MSKPTRRKRIDIKEDLIQKTIVYKIGRRIYFFSDVDADSICEAIKYLDELEKESKKPIEIVFNSEGGSTYDGLALYDRIRQSDCEITTIGTGLVGSMAVILFLAGDYRYVTESCTILNHQGSDSIEGRVSDIEIGFNETKRLEEYLVDLISERTGLPTKKIKADIKKGDDHIKPDRAVDEGFVHEIIKNKRTRRRRRRVTK